MELKIGNFRVLSGLTKICWHCWLGHFVAYFYKNVLEQ